MHLQHKRLPAVVQKFLDRTYPNAKAVSQEMGWLKDAGITPQEFSDFCHEFATGVMYVKSKFPGHSLPKQIMFSNSGEEGLDEDTFALYDPLAKSIIINRDLCRQRYAPGEQFFADHHETIKVTPGQGVILRGIEEAFHHNQNVGGARCLKRHRTKMWIIGENMKYLEDPIEKEADAFVLAAAQELGFIVPQKKGGRGRT